MRFYFVCLIILMAAMMSGCATSSPITMESGFQRKIITPCDNDVLCFRHTYDVTWDTGCRTAGVEYTTSCGYAAQKGYPVSYRSNEYIFETGEYGYLITLPAGGSIRMIDPQDAQK